MAKSTISVVGVKIPDANMAAMLLEAQEQGFRLEPSTGNAGHAAGTGFTVYPPDKAHPPLHVGCVEVNAKHVSNVRSQLRAAGYVPGGKPEEVPTPTAAPEETPVSTATARKPRKTAGSGTSPLGLAADLASPSIVHMGMGEAESARLFDALPREERVNAVARGMSLLASQAGLDDTNAALAAMLFQTVASWEGMSEQYDREDLTAALRLAEENEARAIKAERKLEEATARGSETGRMLTEAREQLAAVTAERDALKKALDPLKALLAS